MKYDPNTAGLQDRLLNESEQLRENCINLQKVLENREFLASAPRIITDQMRYQLRHMKKYAEHLDQRIEFMYHEE